MAETNFSAGAKPIDGVVPNLTWQQFLSYMTGTASAADTSGGEGGSAGFGGQTAATSYGYVPGIGGVGQDIGGNQYVQDLGNGTRNWFSEDPTTGGVVSKNQTADNDSWWDRAGLPLVASLAFGGATAGLSAAGIGASGVGSGIGAGTAYGAAAAGAADAAPSIFGGTALDALGLSPADAAVNVSGGVAPGLEGGTFQNLSGALEGGTDVAPSVVTPPVTTPTSFLDTLTDGVVGGAAGADGVTTLPGVAVTGTAPAAAGGLTAGEVGAGAAGLAGIAGLSTSLGGGPSGTGISYSDAANSAANNTPYSGNANDGAPVSSGSSNSLLSSLTNGNGSSALGSIGKLLSGESLGAGDYASLLGAGGSLLSGILGYKAAGSAASDQVNAANNSNALAAAIYANNTALQQPFVNAGTAATNQQSNLNGLNGAAAQTSAMQGFTADPGYQFALTQGNKAIQNSASAAGGLYSGRAAKDLANYTQGVAAQQYGNYYGRLSGQSTLGQAAASQQAANGNNYTNNVTSNNASIGNAQAAGTVAGTNAITGSLSNLFNQNSSNALLAQLLKNAGASNGYLGGT